VYVDFDGTIAPSDPTDTLFERFCDPSWREIEAEWQQGKRTARECMAQQVDLVRASPQVLDEWLSTVRIDPEFVGFADLCRRWGLQVVVVSDGMDRVVGRILAAAGIKLPYFANQLVWLGGDRWKLEFPYARAGCDIALGNCKCNHRPSSAHRGLDIVVGDGRSDFCIAERAQLVLAKGQLAAHCRAKDLPHWPIDNFADATLFLSSWVARHARKTA
jgi:2,3-diketo-5-methylthio-1-phosphopentane phosphatase